jgi:threonine dehydratase
MLRLIELEKCVVEGGGAIGVAALLQNLVPELKVMQRCFLPVCVLQLDVKACSWFVAGFSGQEGRGPAVRW